MTLNVAAGFGHGMCEAYSDAFSLFSGYADNLAVRNGLLRVGKRERMSFDWQHDLINSMRELR